MFPHNVPNNNDNNDYDNNKNERLLFTLFGGLNPERCRERPEQDPTNIGYRRKTTLQTCAAQPNVS